MIVFVNKLITLFLIFFTAVQASSKEDCGLNLEKEELKNYQYILVPGILNEMITHYMTEYRRYLMSNGVPASQIHRVNLRSISKPDLAVDTIEEAVKDLPKDKGLIFLAHSKGALETLYFLKKQHRNLNFKKTIFIQGSFDGSSMTRLTQKKTFSAFVKFLVKKLEVFDYFKDYNRAYTSKRVRENLSDLYEHPDLLKKSLFIESDTVFEKLNWKFKLLGGQYLEHFGSVGDGVLMGSDHIPYILKDDSSICRWKYDEDHSNLVKAAPWSSLRLKKIRDFLDRVFF